MEVLMSDTPDEKRSASVLPPLVYPVIAGRKIFSELVRRAAAGETIYLGAHRKPQVVMISLDRLAELESRPHN